MTASDVKTKQKPRAVARGFRLCASVRSTRSVAIEDRAGELVVQAAANDVFLEADIVHQRRRAGVEAAEVDPEIFDLGRPVAHEGVFNTKAVDPTHLAFGGGGQGRGAQDRQSDGARRFDVAVSAAGGDVWQPAIEGVAGPAAERGEPGVFGRAGDDDQAGG